MYELKNAKESKPKSLKFGWKSPNRVSNFSRKIDDKTNRKTRNF